MDFKQFLESESSEAYEKIWKPRFEKIEPHREKPFSNLFQGSDRIYFPLTIKDSDFDSLIKYNNDRIKKEIQKEFKKEGIFSILDWKKGLAKDNKNNIWKISNALKNNENLRNDYLSLKIRIEPTNKFLVAISQNTKDIATQSTGKNWQSCNTLNSFPGDKFGYTFKKIAQELLKGGLIAYLIDPEDKEIQKPYARLLLRRYFNPTSGESILACSDHGVYGISSKTFVDAVKNWISKVQQPPKFGYYKRTGGSWISGDPYSQTIETDKIDKTNEKHILKELKNTEDYRQLIYNVIKIIQKQGLNSVSKSFWNSLKKIMFEQGTNSETVEKIIGQLWKDNPNAITFNDLLPLKPADTKVILKNSGGFKESPWGGLEKVEQETNYDKFQKFVNDKIDEKMSIKEFIHLINHIDKHSDNYADYLFKIIEKTEEFMNSKNTWRNKENLLEDVLFELGMHRYNINDETYKKMLIKAVPLVKKSFKQFGHRSFFKRVVELMKNYGIEL